MAWSCTSYITTSRALGQHTPVTTSYGHIKHLACLPDSLGSAQHMRSDEAAVDVRSRGVQRPTHALTSSRMFYLAYQVYHTVSVHCLALHCTTQGPVQRWHVVPLPSGPSVGSCAAACHGAARAAEPARLRLLTLLVVASLPLGETCAKLRYLEIVMVWGRLAA